MLLNKETKQNQTKAPVLLEPHNQIVFFHLQDIVRCLTSPLRSSRCILQPQPTVPSDLRILAVPFILTTTTTIATKHATTTTNNNKNYFKYQYYLISVLTLSSLPYRLLFKSSSQDSIQCLHRDDEYNFLLVSVNS